MLSTLLQLLVAPALLGTALMGGCFFAFSSFVMASLARRPDHEAIAAMQSINVVVINRSFLGTFVGTAALSLFIAAMSIVAWGQPWAAFMFSGAMAYVVVTFLTTIVGNVPLNDELAEVTATDPAARRVWKRYLTRWTAWNHVRTLGAAAATLLYAAGLMLQS